MRVPFAEPMVDLSPCMPAPQATSNHSAFLLALGIVSAPKNTFRREWLRSTVFRFRESEAGAVVMRFVLGVPEARRDSCRGNCPQRRIAASACAAVAREVALGDTLVLNATEGVAVGCVDKAFAWYMHAARAFPGARYVGKTDDDSYNILPNLASLLLSPELFRKRHVYTGWVQYAGFLPSIYQPCGWSGSAAHVLKFIGSGNSDCHRCRWCCGSHCV